MTVKQFVQSDKWRDLTIESLKALHGLELVTSTKRENLCACLIIKLTGSLINAIEYYEWNSALGASLQVPLQSFEIALRNTFIRQLANAFGPHWYAHVTAMMDFPKTSKIVE
ncbi:MAG: hypothetical protein P4L53_26650 [Candidatus Obscuribacterales bacterium]|nr:hypothetical protein [Candidatus Obscuribacterales bacterium]